MKKEEGRMKKLIPTHELDRQPKSKHESSKTQAPNTKETPNSKLQWSKAVRLSKVLELEAWDFPGAWCLGFGVSSTRQL